MRKASVFLKCLPLLVSATIATCSGASAMGLFGTNHLFSEVSGTVVINGKPVSGAEVTQITLWSKPGEVPDVTSRTDVQGRFSFPEITRPAGFFNLVPAEIAIVQKINISFEGKEYRGWLNTKSNFDREGERGRPLRFVCELTHVPSNTGGDFGVCRLV
jgi:hypothetical protein